MESARRTGIYFIYGYGLNNRVFCKCRKTVWIKVMRPGEPESRWPDAKEGKLSGNAKKPGKSIKEKRAEKRAKSAGAEPAPRKRKGQ